MTSPYVTGRPLGREDLSAFYPEWAAPASGFEAEKQGCLDRSAALARDRRRQTWIGLARRIAQLWTGLRQQARPRRRLVRRTPVHR